RNLRRIRSPAAAVVLAKCRRREDSGKTERKQRQPHKFPCHATLAYVCPEKGRGARRSRSSFCIRVSAARTAEVQRCSDCLLSGEVRTTCHRKRRSWRCIPRNFRSASPTAVKCKPNGHVNLKAFLARRSQNSG